MWCLRVMINGGIYETTEPERGMCLDWLSRFLSWALTEFEHGPWELEIRAFTEIKKP